MTINTKFKPGDTVYTLDKKSMKIMSFEIDTVIFCSNPRLTYISYKPADCQVECIYDTYDEDKCFASEKELIDYITKPATAPEAQHSVACAGRP